MSGNIFQWCSDYYEKEYGKYGPLVDPPGPATGTGRVARSGSWFDDDDVDFLSARRSSFAPDVPTIYIGFRCASKP
jgi:formylglycine-generating enzyme required for sulfatase activity